MKTNPTESNSTDGTQFGLVTLFYLVSLFTVGLALSRDTIFISSAVLVFWWIFRQLEGYRKWIFLLIALLVGVSCSLPTLSTPRFYTQRIQCQNNVRQLMLGIIDFEVENRRFPNAVEEERKRQPFHSWRVAILPELGHQKLYDSYDFDEAWDGPNIQS